MYGAGALAGSVVEIRHAGHGLPGGSAGILQPAPGCPGAAGAARDAVASASRGSGSIVWFSQSPADETRESFGAGTPDELYQRWGHGDKKIAQLELDGPLWPDHESISVPRLQGDLVHR